MSDREQQIIDQAHKVFMRLGIRSVNMDDIAQHLRISKKTLYQYVKDKHDLVQKVAQYSCTQHHEAITAICELGLNAIDEQFEIAKFIAGKIGEMHTSIHFDLQKYHPEAWDLLERTQKTEIYQCVTRNMEKGIAEGLYRDDLNIPVIAKIYMARFDAVFDGELFPETEYNFQDIIWEVYRYHIRGIASDKGVKYLMKKVEREHATS